MSHRWKIALAVLLVAFLAALLLPAMKPASEPAGEADWFKAHRAADHPNDHS
jgi:hypothetical protein